MGMCFYHEGAKMGFTAFGTTFAAVSAVGNSGSNTKSVVTNIHKTIGLPMMPPYWSLGYHLSRWGYRSSDDVIGIVEDMKLAKIPLEVQWVDIDYMENHKGEKSATKLSSKNVALRLDF